jgi:hypothetical protein
MVGGGVGAAGGGVDKGEVGCVETVAVGVAAGGVCVLVGVVGVMLYIMVLCNKSSTASSVEIFLKRHIKSPFEKTRSLNYWKRIVSRLPWPRSVESMNCTKRLPRLYFFLYTNFLN